MIGASIEWGHSIRAYSVLQVGGGTLVRMLNIEHSIQHFIFDTLNIEHSNI